MTLPLGNRQFLVSVELEVFYSAPDDMKSMHPEIGVRLWGLSPQRKTPIKD